MEKTFTLRVDLESYRGIKEGIPKLLDLLKKYDIKASFYLVMGGESNIFDILKYRGKMTSSDERKIKIWPIKDKIRMVLFPKDFVKSNLDILQRIIKEGHELGIHAWKHREWTRGLNRINIEKSINKSIKKYIKLFNKKPISFASPGFNTNETVLNVLERKGIRFISDFPGEKVSIYGKIKNVPITIKGEKNTPIIEFLVSKGKKDEDILKILEKEFSRHEIISLYIHDLYESRSKLKLLEAIFKLINSKKIKNKRIIDY